MSWSQRRKATYSIFFLLIAILAVSSVFYFFFYKKSTCFDGIQNQGEAGVDCGGPCVILCRAAYARPAVLWERWSKVLSSGAYSVLAYVQNPNVGSGVLEASYTFKVYDKSNILLFTKSGITYIPASNYFAVFDDGVNIGDKVPARIVFQFADDLEWQKIENKELGITTISPTLTNENTQPKVTATLKNTTIFPMRNIESVVILYDENDNAIAFSKTKTDIIEPESFQDIVFTWPEKFSNKVYKIEIVSKVLPE